MWRAWSRTWAVLSDCGPVGSGKADEPPSLQAVAAAVTKTAAEITAIVRFIAVPLNRLHWWESPQAAYPDTETPEGNSQDSARLHRYSAAAVTHRRRDQGPWSCRQTVPAIRPLRPAV